MGVSVDCARDIIEVWRDNRFKGLAGIGETSDDGNVTGGNDEDEDDEDNWVPPLIPCMPSRETRFVEARDNPACCNEAILPAIDLFPEELRERHIVRTALERKPERHLL